MILPLLRFLYRITRPLRWLGCVMVRAHSGRDKEGRCWFCQTKVKQPSSERFYP